MHRKISWQTWFIVLMILLMAIPSPIAAVLPSKIKPTVKAKPYTISATPFELIPPDMIEPTVIINTLDDHYYPCDQMPKPLRSISANIHYPKAILDPDLYGLEIIHALINEQGKVEKCIVAKEILYARLTEAFVATVKNTPFQPAIRVGHPVAVWVGIPIEFKLKKKDFVY